MTGQAIQPADSETYLDAMNVATQAFAKLSSPEDRSQLAWELADQFCQPGDHSEIEAEAAENAVIETIRARPTAEHADILNRITDEFTAPPKIAWSELMWAVTVAVVTALAVVQLHGLTELSRGAVLGFGLAFALAGLWNFTASLIDHFREKQL